MAKSTIRLKAYGEPIVYNPDAGGAITPGMIVKENSSGDVIAHNAANQPVAPIMVARENFLEGKGVDDAYSSGNKTVIWIPGRGDEGYMWLKGGENVSIGDFLASGGDGRLVKWEAASSAGVIEYPNAIVGVATEAVDASESASAHARIKVRFV